MRMITVSYHASMEDELSIKEGEIIHCIREFDDGWAYGCNPHSQNHGFYPHVFTKEVSISNAPPGSDSTETSTNFNIPKRESSYSISVDSILSTGTSRKSSGLNLFRANSNWSSLKKAYQDVTKTIIP